MRNFLSSYLGILIGGIYGLVARLAFDTTLLSRAPELGSLSTVTFVFFVPMIIGIIPMFFASNKQINSVWYRIRSPLFTVLVFFGFAVLTQLEDAVCLVILGFPYLILAGLTGALGGWMIAEHRRKKGLMFALMVLPFLLAPLENAIPNPISTFSVHSKVRIDAPPSIIWEQVVSVSPISETEFSIGFFHWAGVPRPLRAELFGDSVGGRRIGYFEGGLVFEERVTQWEPNHHVRFEIDIPKESIGDKVFDQHVLGRGYFKFMDAGYSLHTLNDGSVLLELRSSYLLNTKLNWYGAFWANLMLEDFQSRLLQVIRKRCELAAESAFFLHP